MINGFNRYMLNIKLTVFALIYLNSQNEGKKASNKIKHDFCAK